MQGCACYYSVDQYKVRTSKHLFRREYSVTYKEIDINNGNSSSGAIETLPPELTQLIKEEGKNHSAEKEATRGDNLFRKKGGFDNPPGQKLECY